ncbi:ABC-type sugar transport system [Anopheles sinensis]|uniref:ABC-type sugar transport system n=1 Tax=Anopheles sinensis TaxID=74873 RepID=A0A084VKK6_ANOSI|nr:ABC-type sugar transport system [Anopheles sinensis]
MSFSSNNNDGFSHRSFNGNSTATQGGGHGGGGNGRFLRLTKCLGLFFECRGGSYKEPGTVSCCFGWRFAFGKVEGVRKTAPGQRTGRPALVTYSRPDAQEVHLGEGIPRGRVHKLCA